MAEISTNALTKAESNFFVYGQTKRVDQAVGNEPVISPSNGEVDSTGLDPTDFKTKQYTYSLEYFKNLLGLPDFGIKRDSIKYDEQGRVTDFEITYPILCAEGFQQRCGDSYIIKYNQDGTFIVTKTGQFHGSNWGGRDITSDVAITKYDENGNIMEEQRNTKYDDAEGGLVKTK